jgi:hypothetical protein
VRHDGSRSIVTFTRLSPWSAATQTMTPRTPTPTVKIPISLIRGGTFYRVQEKARLIHPRAWNLRLRIPLAIGVAWAPLLVLAAMHGGLADVRPLLLDYRVHARVFIAIPLLLLAQVTMETRFRAMSQQFLDENIVRLEDLSRFRAIMQKMRRLRDAHTPELIVVLIVYAQAMEFIASGRLRLASWAIDAGSSALTPAGYYSILVTQAIFMALLLIAFWKWAIWVYVLWRISRLDLRLDATNGDLNGGLGFLGEVPRAFVPLVLAVSTVIATNFRWQVLLGLQTLDTLTLPAAVLAVLMLLIFFLPLALFTPALLAEKRDGTIRYGALQHLLSLQFRQKWVQHRTEHLDELVGSPDVSSLADASAAFKNVEQMAVYPFRKGAVVSFLAALALPSLAVVTTRIPLKQILSQLLEAIR